MPVQNTVPVINRAD